MSNELEFIQKNTQKDYANIVILNSQYCATLSDIILHPENPEEININIAAEFGHKNIQLIYLATGDSKDQAIRSHVKINIAENLEVNLIENFVSSNASVTHHQTEINLNRAAKIKYIKYQHEHQLASHRSQASFYLAEKACAETYHLATGSVVAQSDLNIIFHGEKASAKLYGLYISKNRQRLEQRTLVEHKAAHCESDELYHGIIADKSHAVFNGKVIVREGASGTKAIQANHNLLLSSDAEIDTRPELEIYHDDLQCSHGATIGQLDEEALFYLRSRGMSKTDARKFLLEAFAGQILNKLEDFKVAQEIMANM